MSPGGAFGTCSYDRHPRVHVTFDSAAAAAAYPVVRLDSSWICQSRLLRRTRCETFDRSCRRNGTRSKVRDAAAVTDVLLHLRTVAAAAAGDATMSGGCCIVAPRDSRQYSPPLPAKTKQLARGFSNSSFPLDDSKE